MARGRPPSGPKLLQRLDGSSQAKARLKAVLETLAGKRTIPDACRELGIGEAAFHKMRQKVLQSALGSLHPAPAGRPPAVESAQDSRMAELEAQVRELRLQLQAARVREEIAIAMPHLLKAPQEKPQKKGRHKRSRGKSRRR